MAIHKIKFHRSRFGYLAKIAWASATTGQSEVRTLQRRRIQPCYNESIRGCTVFISIDLPALEDNLMELLMMIDAARRIIGPVAVMPASAGRVRTTGPSPRADRRQLVANMLMAALSTV